MFKVNKHVLSANFNSFEKMENSKYRQTLKINLRDKYSAKPVLRIHEILSQFDMAETDNLGLQQQQQGG